MHSSLPSVAPAIPADAPDWPDDFAHRYRDAGYWQDTTFFEALDAQAQRAPDALAVVDGTCRLSYRDLLARIRQLAGGLARLGLVRGDAVVVHLPNGARFIETCFALFQLGVRPVLALPAHRHYEIGAFCRFAGARAYLCAAQLGEFDCRPLAAALQADCPTLEHVVMDGDDHAFTPFDALYDAPPLRECAARADDIACFQLSGGTTGTPKLIPRRHREYLYNVRACSVASGFDAGTVYLAALPMAHNFTLCCPGTIGALLAGGRVVATGRPEPEQSFALIAQERVTHTALVPPLALLWLDEQPQRRADLSSLRVLQVGGARLMDHAAARVTPVLGCRLQQVFGMAEGLICCTRLDDSPERIAHTQGRPVSDGDEVRIVDDAGEPVAPGEIGELQVRGPYTIRGYYRLAGHNATAFTADGFYRSGDRVRRTADGDLVVEGRDKDQINRGGEKVSAEEVENLLLAHPQVHDAAVVAMPDPLLGERTCAFVVARAPAPSRLVLKRYLRDCGLAAFKIPDRIEFMPRFPETGIGKTSKKSLRDLLRRQLQAAAA
ncbi:2,3-dihydroxybenzoate-AMP ligase [Burkholderia cepacia]|uniref:2,3-dihydroxybenzoate-AMP ligase n=1 Tax=Burkholderia cepacia TaxID=292 RepID=A0AAX2RX41_BURCE|nr:AMP-binding protein [Burkholderia cepacia]TES74924.1 2,3-dihydroxybenzoate-AMP ligase [Burkholderia cepacia]TET01848.1 2,3-dihydroxybenzoate-AMP ligase [Burkholderia cepacia]TEU45766.1 2,3-dihydroxybenzoate-AMP ligase [Burkholderia cepacia]TEU52691.1 2,3-dihydroxybenzoate-AMP ligase [Burkholderia cepacia]TEU52833.1 2,3-dihydroxybenzoate-AMP ligase [Burkholderia cepacia]